MDRGMFRVARKKGAGLPAISFSATTAETIRITQAIQRGIKEGNGITLDTNKTDKRASKRGIIVDFLMHISWKCKNGGV